MYGLKYMLQYKNAGKIICANLSEQHVFHVLLYIISPSK